MAKLFGINIGGDNQNPEEEAERKSAEKIQNYLNKYKMSSRDLDNTEAMEDRKKQNSEYGWQGYSWLKNATTTSDERVNRYKEYREMCKVPELNQGLHIYADNATQYNVNNNVLEIESDNQKIVDLLERLFFERLDINANLWWMAKNVCKFGDEFVEVIPDSIKTPKNIISLERIKKPEYMKRVENDNNLEKFTYQYEDDEKDDKDFEPWQIIHFRIEDDDFDPYGKSVLESGRKTFKRLSLMEDAMLVYRISRAPERRVFYIDVGTLSTKEANHYIEQLKRKFKKKSFINPTTGQVDEKANPLAVDEDFFIAVRAESQGTRIETLPPGQNLGEIDDVKYFKDQILRTMGIPNGYLGGVSEGGAAYDPKSYLSNQEIQFSRTVERIQKFIVKGLEKVAIIELALHKMESEDLKNFKIKLTPPSNVDQLMEIEIRNQKMALIQSIKSLAAPEGAPFLPDEWIYKNILGMSEKEISQIKLQAQMQMQLAAQMAAIATGAAAGPGGGIPTGGGASGGMDLGGLGGPAPAEAGAITPPEGSGAEPGGEPGGEEAIGAEPGLDVAGQDYTIFDGAKWLLENGNDAQKLLKYIKLYEKVHKDNNKKKKSISEQSSVTRMTIKGELRGLLKAHRSPSNGNTLIESKNTSKDSQKKKSEK